MSAWMATALTGAMLCGALPTPIHEISVQGQPLPVREILDPLATTAEMRHWVSLRLPRGLPQGERWKRLAEELLAAPGWSVSTLGEPTPTAAEAFAARRADCVAFAHVVVALAREVGIDAFFVVAREPWGTQTRGDLRVEEEHLAAAYGRASRPMVLDLDGLWRPAPGTVHRVSDTTARAIVLSNRGASALLAGDLRRAQGWLRGALQLDPELAAARRNLEVVQRRVTAVAFR